jgi:hypothetical protein
MKQTLPLLIALLLVGTANAQQSGPLPGPPPDRAAVKAFVEAIDNNFYMAYAQLAFYDQPINLAARLYLSDAPLPNNALLRFDYEEVFAFNYYWVAAGSSASLSDPNGIFFGSTPGVDTPWVVARDIIRFTNDRENQISFAKTGQNLQGTGNLSLIRAPEIDPASAASGLTLLLGGLLVLRGGRAKRSSVPISVRDDQAI